MESKDKVFKIESFEKPQDSKLSKQDFEEISFGNRGYSKSSINNINDFFKFLIVLGFLIIIISSNSMAAGITVEDAKNLEKVNSEMKTGNFDNMLKTLDKADITHVSILFGGLDNSKLIDAWNKMEVKKANGEVDVEKTNKYRQLLLMGVDSSLENGKKALDSFIGSLIKSNNKAKEFEFVGSGNSKEIMVDGNFISLKDSSGDIYKIPLKDIDGFKKIVFSQMEGGGEGYAVHYVPEKGSDSGAVLSSGYLKNNKNRYDVMDLVNNEIKFVGKISFGDNPSGAVYFRGSPKPVGGETFSKGDYIFHKSGTEGDISFEDESGILSSSGRDILNSDGQRVGYQTESGVRGNKKLDINGDKKPDVSVDIIHQNRVGIKYGDKIIGPKSNKNIEIKNNGNDISVRFSEGIINTEIINNNGRVVSVNNQNQEVYSGRGEALKIVSGQVNGILVNRQDSNAGSGSGNVNPGNNPISGTDYSNIINSNLNGAFNQLNPGVNNGGSQNNPNNGMDSFSAAAYNSVNRVRGSSLVSDPEMNKMALQYSQNMAARGRLVHSNMPYAENIATFSGYGQLSAEQVGQRFATMWKNSQGHYNNIVNSRYSRTGIGVYYDQGTNTWWATQIFN